MMPDTQTEGTGMSEMVERVARAIAGDSADMPWTYLHVLSEDTLAGKETRTTEVVPYWRSFEGFARAAIAAMREPTGDMDKAGQQVLRDHMLQGSCHIGIWEDMIDEALR